MVAYRRAQTEKDRTESGDSSPDVITEPSPSRAQQCREQRRQIHGEQRKQTLKEADERQPAEQRVVAARDAVGRKHHHEIAKAHPNNGLPVTYNSSKRAGEEISKD